MVVLLLCVSVCLVLFVVEKRALINVLAEEQMKMP